MKEAGASARFKESREADKSYGPVCVGTFKFGGGEKADLPTCQEMRRLLAGPRCSTELQCVYRQRSDSGARLASSGATSRKKRKKQKMIKLSSSNELKT